jgi:hypothetical protein
LIINILESHDNPVANPAMRSTTDQIHNWHIRFRL